MGMCWKRRGGGEWGWNGGRGWIDGFLHVLSYNTIDILCWDAAGALHPVSVRVGCNEVVPSRPDNTLVDFVSSCLASLLIHRNNPGERKRIIRDGTRSSEQCRILVHAAVLH